LEPNGGLIRFLLQEKGPQGELRFDVFTLDWRASHLLFGAFGDEARAAGKTAEDYRIDRVAEEDIPAGMAAGAAVHPGRPIAILAHCLGSAAAAHAIACGSLGAAGQPPLGPIVLATVGLFYRMGIDGWLKTADNIMRPIEAAGTFAVSPHVALV